MKCTFVIDMHMDTDVLDETQKHKLEFRPRFDKLTNEIVMDGWFPAGTEYEHPNAAFFVNNGMAIAADPECEAAAEKISPEERARREMAYRATAAGVQDPAHRKLFFAGFIDGYIVEGEKVSFKPGKNWEKYQAALAQARGEKASDI